MIDWNPFNKTVKKNPYPHYAKAAKQSNVFESYADLVYVLDYSTVKHMLSKPDLFLSPYPMLPERLDMAPFKEFVKFFFIFQNGQAHQENRKIALKAYNVKRIPQIVDDLTNQYISKVKDRTEIDLVEDFASPLYASIVCKILGFPVEDAPKLEVWGPELFHMHDLYYHTDLLQHLNKLSAEIMDYFQIVIDKEIQDSESLVAKMWHNLKSSGKSDEETLAMIISIGGFFIDAGIETVTSALSNSMYHLLKSPNIKTQLNNHPDLIPSAVEELLRFDPPIQFVIRKLGRQMELNGTTYQAGRYLALCVGSANRDPNEFEQHNEIVLDRKKNAHLAFGYGRHHCLGANLARINLRASIKSLLSAFPDMELIDFDPALKECNILKGYKSLKIRIQ